MGARNGLDKKSGSMTTSLRRLFGLCFCTFAILSAPVDAIASPQSDVFVKAGLQRLKANNVTGAARMFTRALNIDPKDASTAFYLGVSFNRLGQHGAALAAACRPMSIAG
jgi:Tfp pilus assembly protein PilF